MLFCWDSNSTGTSVVRIAVCLFIVMGATMGCDRHEPCLEVGSKGEFGTNHLEKMELLSSFVEELGLQTPPHEVAAIVGAAYAASQIKGGQAGVPVKICLRPGKGRDTEYRVLSIQGEPLIDWRSTSDFRAR